MKKQDVLNRLKQIESKIHEKPIQMRIALLELLGGVVNANCGLSYCIVMKNGDPYFVDMFGFGSPEYIENTRKSEGQNMKEFFKNENGEETDVLLENPYFSTGFCTGETEEFRGFSGYKIAFEPNRIKSILGSYLFIDDELAGWFGVYRTFDEKSFSKKELAAAKEYEDDFVRIFTETIKINPWHLPDSGAFGILDGKGRVTSSSAEAPDWFAKGLICRELRDSAKTFLESDLNSRELFIKRHAVTLTRMRSTGSDSVHVNIIPTKPQPVPALVSLTARQRSVAQEILAGLTIPEVASELNLSVETVRSHLKAIYSIFDVSNRIEFVKAASANAKTPPA